MNKKEIPLEDLSRGMKIVNTFNSLQNWKIGQVKKVYREYRWSKILWIQVQGTNGIPYKICLDTNKTKSVIIKSND